MPSRRNMLIFGSTCLACRALAGGAFPRSVAPAGLPGSATALGCGFEQVVKVPMARARLGSSGLRIADQVIATESILLNRYFNVAPRLQYHDDNGAAEALTLRDHGGIYITIGNSLIENEITSDAETWRSVVIGILAHEWAHAFQYEHGLQEKVYLWETHADFLAGWYFGTRRAAENDQPNATAFARALAARANQSGYFDENSHGNPAQRTEAMFAGLAFGSKHYVVRYGPDVDTAAGAGYAYVKKIRHS